jgi:hypothetical protein
MLAGGPVFDFQSLPQGGSYEDRYQQYLKLFEQIAAVPQEHRVIVDGAPWSWVPLLEHLRCDFRITPRVVFDHCGWVRNAWQGDVYNPINVDRTAVEVLCSFRPETADALWKCDMQWSPKRVRKYKPVDEFIVTTNGSFHRPEVLTYLHRLEAHIPIKRKCLLVPCAADKPYPAPLHSACIARLPDDFDIIIATGVVGLAPSRLWPVMPRYDSGIPNKERLYGYIKYFFSRYQHDRVVVYCDFYSETIREAFGAIGQYDLPEFVLPVKRYDDYEDLLNPTYLRMLELTLRS